MVRMGGLAHFRLISRVRVIGSDFRLICAIQDDETMMGAPWDRLGNALMNDKRRPGGTDGSAGRAQGRKRGTKTKTVPSKGEKWESQNVSSCAAT